MCLVESRVSKESMPCAIAQRSQLEIMSAALCHAASSLFRTAAFRSSTHTRGRALRQTARMSIVSPSAKPLYDLYVKGSPEKGELGDCVPYNKLLLDENSIPEWVKEVCEGQKQIPFALELETGKWLYDSDKMIPYFEEKFPQKKLGRPDELPSVGGSLFPTFMGFLQAQGGEQGEKEQELVAQLREVNDALGQSDGPFLGGKEPNSNDCKLGPQLKHVIIGSKTIKGWTLPSELDKIPGYMAAWEKRPSWENTYYTEKYVQDGWQVKMKKMASS